jgi:hypothetical protein
MENSQEVISVTLLPVSVPVPVLVPMTKGKLKKFASKLIELGFTTGLLPSDDPKGWQLSSNVSSAVYQACRTRRPDDVFSYIKNIRTRASVAKTFKGMTEEDKTLFKAEVENYLKPQLVSYDQASAYIRRNIIDLSKYRVRYYYKGNEYTSYSDHNTMYQNCSNSLHSDREDAKRVFNAALDKLCAGLSGEPLYDMLMNITYTDVTIKEGKYLGSRHSDVVSSSFTTYYDYEYEAVFKNQTVTFNYTHSSHYSGGW